MDAAAALRRVQDVEPVEKFRVLAEGSTVLGVADDLVVVYVNFTKDVLDVAAVYANMAVDEAAPVGDHLRDIVIELLEAEGAVAVLVHEGEAELVLFVVSAIAEHVHDRCELAEHEIALFLTIKHVKDTVSQEWVLLLAQKAQLRPELLLPHDLDGAFNLGASRVLNEDLLSLRGLLEVRLKLIDFFFREPRFMFRLLLLDEFHVLFEVPLRLISHVLIVFCRCLHCFVLCRG